MFVVGFILLLFYDRFQVKGLHI